MDPVLTSLSGKPLITMCYDWLIGVDTDGNLSKETGVATDWELSPDSMTLTVHIRSGIKFHNGDELTSADVKFSLEQFTSERSVTSNSNYLRKLIKDVEAPDPLTVVVHYNDPSAVLPNYLSRQQGQEGVVLPKKYIEEIGVENFGAHPVGSGPYKFVEYMVGSELKYEAVDYPHWLVGVPKFKDFTIYLIKEESTRIAMLKTGAADIITISRDKIKEVPDFKIYEKKGASVIGLYVNNQWDTTTYLSNEKFREALNLAINREEIRDFIFEGSGDVTGSGPMYGSWAWGYKPVPLYTYDPDKAKQLVQEAFPGETPSVNLYTSPSGGIPEMPTVAEAVAGYWEKIGIETKIIPVEYSAYRAELGKEDPDLDNCFTTVGMPDRLMWDGAFKFLFLSGSMFTTAHDPNLDALIDALASEYNPDMVGQRQYDIGMYLREHHLQVPILEVGIVLAANPENVPQWPHVSAPLSQDFWLDDVYTR